jgi:hypothetical protein
MLLNPQTTQEEREGNCERFLPIVLRASSVLAVAKGRVPMLKLPTTEVPFPAVYNARWVVFSIWREGSQAIDAVELRKKRIADSGVNTLTYINHRL